MPSDRTPADREPAHGEDAGGAGSVVDGPVPEDEAFRRIVVRELTADTERARLRWLGHKRRCLRRFFVPCAQCTGLEQEFRARLRNLCDGALRVITR